MLDTKDVPNQVEENASNSVRDNFFSLWSRCNESQPKEELIIHSKVLNLSKVSLTPSQFQILSKGLKFTSTPQRNLSEMEKDIQDFTGKLRLVEFSSENPEFNTTDSSLVKNKSNFCHPQTETVLWNLQLNFYKNKACPR